LEAIREIFINMVVHRESGNYSSRSRNRAIAKICKEAGMIEKYGLGIKRIQNTCKGNRIVAPKFE
jgi:ATP-dependent DNA helicase RecG